MTRAAQLKEKAVSIMEKTLRHYEKSGLTDRSKSYIDGASDMLVALSVIDPEEGADYKARALRIPLPSRVPAEVKEKEKEAK